MLGFNFCFDVGPCNYFWPRFHKIKYNPNRGNVILQTVIYYVLNVLIKKFANRIVFFSFV